MNIIKRGVHNNIEIEDEIKEKGRPIILFSSCSEVHNKEPEHYYAAANAPSDTPFFLYLDFTPRCTDN